MFSSKKDNVQILKLLANSTRLEILKVIINSKTDLCVNQISELTKTSQPLASLQLGLLARNGVLESRRVGQTICYYPAKNDFSNKVFKILKALES